MKLWERVIKRRLWKDISISENQFGFMPGRLTIEVIYLLRRLMGLYRDRKTDFYMVFIDLEKAYDRVPHKLLWWCLEKKGVSPGYIRIIKDMYERVGRVLGCQEGLSMTSTLAWACIRVPL